MAITSDYLPLAADLVKLEPAILLALTATSDPVLRAATATIPIVFTAWLQLCEFDGRLPVVLGLPIIGKLLATLKSPPRPAEHTSAITPCARFPWESTPGLQRH